MKPNNNASAILEMARQLYPDGGFVIISLKPDDNSANRSEVDVATNLAGATEAVYWIETALDGIKNEGMKKRPI